MINHLNLDTIKKKRQNCLRDACVWAEMTATKDGINYTDRSLFIRTHTNKTLFELDYIISKIQAGKPDCEEHLTEFNNYCRHIKFKLNQLIEQENKKVNISKRIVFSLESRYPIKHLTLDNQDNENPNEIFSLCKIL